MELTAEEKAKELVDKFSKLVTTWDCYWDCPRNEDDVMYDAKQCALIAVDEILNVLENDVMLCKQIKRNYWQEVKQEINNLQQWN